MFRGQTVSLDFALGFMLFVLVWVFLITQFDQKFDDTLRNSDLKTMQLKAETILETLVKTKGTPENWETLTMNELEKPGLAVNDRELSQAKLSAFSNMASDYSEMKIRLGSERYDFFFKFDGVDDINAGLLPGSNANEINLERIVIYKGEIGVARLKLYRLE